MIKTERFPLQDLKTRLKEEAVRLRATITDQSSEDDKDRPPCELEVTLPFTHCVRSKLKPAECGGVPLTAFIYSTRGV